MSTDLNEHPHYALLQSESYVSPSEREWLAWVKKVEAALGHSLDGNQDRDGYSLDYAHDAWCDGCTPGEHAAEIAEEKAALGRGDDEDDSCLPGYRHKFECTGTAYGGDDESYHGEGRSYCVHCGADGDA